METNYTEFSDPRIVALYDTLNPFGEDSEFFCEQAKNLEAKTIIDLGCGTGLLTVELAKLGHHMIGIEPSEAMLAVARMKPYADTIKWVQWSFEKMNGLKADMVIMTSHVAQFFLDDTYWQAMIETTHQALNNNGHLIFDIRRLTHPPFPTFPTEDNRRKLEDTLVGAVEWWCKHVSVENRRVQYELHYFFPRSGEEIVSLNELVFRSQEEITETLSKTGFEIETIYGDWDGSPVNSNSPEMIFVAKPI